MKTVHIRTSNPYDVIIERGIISKCGEYISSVTKSKKAAVITDDIVGRLYADTVCESLRSQGFEVGVFTFPNGEASKNLDTLSKIYNYLCEFGITRSDFLIALGGGVVGDITGLAAATFLRGIDFVQIPTTLLAQVDSSVGGKTAVDIAGGKNLVGAFKQPVLVLCDSNTLSTLPETELACGMAEAIKYGMIRDKKLFELIESHNISNVDEVIDDIVYTSIDIKRDVVEHDEFDKGERFILNFGHTLGHAIEGWHNYTDYTHGMGVAAGMCMMTDRFCAPELAERLRRCVTAYKLPTGTEAPMEKLLPFCSVDKKRELDSISFIVCEEIGKAEIRRVTLDEFYRLMGV
ncbi:MAG: 3-dehydroquinate synthase [Ruminococcus sp.]|nr:3-dehydroquinate synthase [Ruminococcus sp.]